jgi:hypothetical protein
MLGEYSLIWPSTKRTRVLGLALLLGTAMFGTFAPSLINSIVVAATPAECHLAIAILITFALAMLAFSIYSYYAISLILSWVEGYVHLCRQAATVGPHKLSAQAAQAVHAYGRLEAAYGPIAYGQLLCILDLYRVMSGLVVSCGIC